MSFDYEKKWISIKDQTLLSFLPLEEQERIRELAFQYQFTLQELKISTEQAKDLLQWEEISWSTLWKQVEAQLFFKKREKSTDLTNEVNKNSKKLIWNQVCQHYEKIQTSLKKYTSGSSKLQKKPLKIIEQKNNDKILGLCPVHSEKTLCCRLHTIDAVKNCGFGCSYCAIQTMFEEKPIIFDPDFSQKVKDLKLNKETFYHIGSGQSSDALMWGNRQGILDTLIDLAREYPRILLEFKTKSHNISYFLTQSIPQNIICTWSLNPQIIIQNEEHQTASLQERLQAARQVADKGIKVGFHFHPIFYYDQWKTDYFEIIQEVQKLFQPDEVFFVSFGSMTLPKPVMQKIRTYPYPTKVTQFSQVLNPEKKITYQDKTKIEIFKFLYESFRSWHQSVFFYLCMEEPRFWQQAFGYTYQDNFEFEKAMEQEFYKKIKT